MTPEQEKALTVARGLAKAGVPIFLARPAMADGQWDPAGGHNGCGYWLPKGWENTSPNPRYLEAWRPGMAVCAVMGHVLDLVDLDPRNGGDPAALNGTMPKVYAVASTPSDGWHGFVRSLGVRSRDAVLPGIDIKAGDPDGHGRGFAFIAPTVKLSKATGELGTYRWVTEPNFEELLKAADDASGRKLAELVDGAHGSKRKPTGNEEQAGEARDWMVADVIPRGQRYPWLRSYAGWLREKNIPLAEARALMKRRWEACEQPPDYPMPWRDAEALLEDIYSRYAPGRPIDAPTVLAERWADPLPLGQNHPPPLPVDACGPVLKPLVQEVSQALQVPPDLVINMALSVVATAAQGRWLVRVRPDWTEIVSISSTSVAASGERKSPVLSILSTILSNIESELREQAQPTVAWREEEIKLAEARVAEARKAAQKDPHREPELKAELEALRGLKPLHLPRLMADDATPEALIHVLDQQKGTIGVLSAEPGFFSTLAGRYNHGVANLDGVLKATSGEPIRVDRVKGDPILIERPCLSVSVCVQPGLLEQLGKRPELRHAGFLARFLYVAPRPMVGTRVVSIMSTGPIDKPGFEGSLSLYNSHIRHLALHAYSLRYVTKQLTQSTELHLDPEANKLLDEFRTELEPRLHPQSGDLATIADWGSKLPGAAVRIAAAMTLLEDPEAEQIEVWTMGNAIELARAYIPHAVAVLDGIRGHRDDHAEARDVLRIARSLGRSVFSVRDIARQLANTGWVKGHAGRPAEAVEEQLELLSDYGHVRPVPEVDEKRPGRKPSPRYELNPIHLAGDTP